MRRILYLMVASVILFSAAACSSSETAKPSLSSTSQVNRSTSSTSPTSTSDTEGPTTTTAAPSGATDAELGQAIGDFWATYDELGASKAPFDPAIRARLEEHSTGNELATLFNYFQGNALAGLYIRGGIDSSLTVISVTDSEARVRDCYDDQSGLYRISTDERIDVDDPARHQVLYTLVNESDVWKVANITDEGSGCVVSS